MRAQRQRSLSIDIPEQAALCGIYSVAAKVQLVVEGHVIARDKLTLPWKALEHAP
jgi:hypothetical protein